KVFFSVVNGNPVELPLLEKDTNYVAVRIPVDAPEGMYMLKVGNSQPVYINRARVMSYEYDEVMPGTVFRLFGRNMWMNKNAKVQFVHPTNGRTANADIIKGDAFSL